MTVPLQEPPQFNIVYTPGTVRYLQLFVFSLLKWMGCSFRLVANGCAPEEERLLQKLAQQSPRLEFLALPFKTMMPHPQALTYLQSVERGDRFCFMDSDIMATGDFAGELTPYLGQYAGVFSGSPLFCSVEERTLPPDYPGVAGRFNRTETGICLGSTYLAMYDNRVLTQVIRSTGIGFGRRGWSDIPTRYRRWLVEQGLQKEVYDTGKLLNLLLLAHGEQLIFVESPSLKHIAGMSWYVLRESGVRGQGAKRDPAALRGRWGLRRLPLSLGSKSNPRRNAVADARTEVKAKKHTVSHYFTELLRSLLEYHPPPEAPDMGDSEIEETIESVAAAIIALYEEFGERLVC